MTEQSQHQTRKRKLKGPKREKKEKNVRKQCTPSLHFPSYNAAENGIWVADYHGERARFILAQALTMLVSQQVTYLGAEISAPPELEVRSSLTCHPLDTLTTCSCRR